MPAEELGPLPAGRHGYSREQVAHHQRERLIAGLAAAVAEKGYAAVTLADITREARVSRRVFYQSFESKEACFLAAFEVVVAHLRELVAAAVGPLDGWPKRAIAATRAAFDRAVAELEPPLRLGRGERPSGERPLPDSTEHAVLGSLVSLVQRQVAAGEAARLEDLLPDCAEFVLAPYLGAAEASRLARTAA
jgi:AcrR family transcriptional regulator